ncbi:MAG: leucyl aminopeptidase [bacterium]
MITINFAKNPGLEGVVIVPVLSGTIQVGEAPEWANAQLAALAARGDFKGKVGEVVSVSSDSQKIVFVGLGEKAKLASELSKTAGGKAWNFLGDVSEQTVGVLLDKSLKPNIALKIVEGLLLRNYLDGRYKTGEELEGIKKKLFDNLTVIGVVDAAFKKELGELVKIVEAIHFVRDLVSAPPVDLKPEDLAHEAAKIAQQFPNVKFSALTKKEIEEEGMGLLAAVNRGSAHEPRMIVLELNPERTEKPIVLVGKGLTFDSGGYNLKPSGAMETMHTDMAAGATVIGTIKALASLGIKKKVIGIVPATENLISGAAYKPSDIIKSYSGKTVEIMNTDAEGRLVLADALSYAIKEFNPQLVVDLATLTGACITALGERYAGLFSNQAELVRKVEQASKLSGDKVWPLPLDEQFKEKMKSKVADLGNLAQGLDRIAGASTGAAFLSYFVGDTPWVHIDIAGPSSQAKELESWNPPSGATGYGVSLLVSLIRNS